MEGSGTYRYACWGDIVPPPSAETTWASISGLTEVKMLLQVGGDAVA